MTETSCPHCNASNRDTARYCAECGSLLHAEFSPSAGQSENSDANIEQTNHDPNGSAPEAEERVLAHRYRIEVELGRGGFGAVYAAWDTNLNRKCAVKENLETTPEAQRQFTREATILANLSHPHLPRVIDHFTISGQGQYLVMDYVEGEDLLSLIGRQGQLTSEQTVRWGIQVCEALVYLHDQNPPVLHRDIKPANIRITPVGKAMLVDFGLVKIFSPQLKTTLGARAVTPGYAPPEQYGQGVTDVRSDIYALGATLYNLLTGLDPLESVQRVMGRYILPIREISPGVPKELESIVERAMALDPSERFQNCGELLEALQSCLRPKEETLLVSRAAAPQVAQTMQMPDVPSLGSQTSIARSGTMPMPRSQIPGAPQEKRRPVWLWLGIGGVALAGLFGLAVLGGMFVLFSPSTDKTPTAARGIGLTPPTRTPNQGKASPVPDEPTPVPAFRSSDPETYTHLAYGEPNTLDPALDYETSGSEIIANLYDTLIFYKKGDANVFVPQLALDVPSFENGGIQEEGRLYRFRIRPGVKFHNGQPLTPEDVAYTFQRGILQGGGSSPQWLFTEPLLGIGIYDISFLVDPDLLDQPERLASADPDRLQEACQRVMGAIQVEGEEVVFRLAQPWSPFLATLATSFGSIVSQEWVMQNGGWDGDCASWQNFYGRTLAEVNATPLGMSAMGSGPYALEKWDAGKELVLKANEDYWMKEPAWDGAPSGPPAIKRVVIRFIDDFETRFTQLQAAEADSIEIESSTRWQNLDRLVGRICSFNDEDCRSGEDPDAPLELVRGSPSTRREDIFFNWEVNTEGGNEYVGSGKLNGDGVPPNFFSNVHVRRAFAYCFNYGEYLSAYLAGEGVRTINVMPPGMVGYNPDSPYYVYDPRRCEDEFRQAEFEGRSVWEMGFKLGLPFDSGDPQLEIIATIFQDELVELNERFRVEARASNGGDYYAQRSEYRLPLFLGGWSEDIHDPHNWVYPYAIGTFARNQRMPAEVSRRFGDIISRGVAAVDPEQRATIYQGFNELYYEEAPAILLFSTVDRHYQHRWVNGWYDNPINPGIYYYALRKD